MLSYLLSEVLHALQNSVHACVHIETGLVLHAPVCFSFN
jgi:hypothetical protein